MHSEQSVEFFNFKPGLHKITPRVWKDKDLVYSS